jgi:glucan biosynthesis protein C
MSEENLNMEQEKLGPPKDRIFFVDYLRASIISLVILHHLALTYAANSPFYYVEPTTDSVALLVLVIFQLSNQAWFMGLLFLLSGYLSPSSIDRKGSKQFLKDRLIRFGIPILILSFLINPITDYIGTSHLPPAVRREKGITLPLTPTWQGYFSSIGPGILWFLILLLIFDFGYAAWRISWRNKNPNEAKIYPFPKYRTIIMFILLLAATSYLIRIILPLGQYMLFFPTLAYLPEYLSFFIIGIIAARGDWLRKMPGSMAKRFFIIALIASFTLFPLALLGTITNLFGGGSLVGNGSLWSGVYALWESTYAVGVSVFLIAFFRRFFNSRGKLWQFLSQHSYTVYLIHIIIIVTLAGVVLSLISMEPLLKFCLAGVIAIPLCWGAAYLVRKIPFADRIL